MNSGSVIIITKNKFAESTFEKSTGIVRSTFKGRYKENLAIEHLDELGEFYSNSKIEASIVDISGVYGSFVKAMDYIKLEFLPKIKLSDIKVKAYVVSDDIIVSHLSTKLVESDKYNDIKSKVFSDYNKAEDWISEYFEKR